MTWVEGDTPPPQPDVGEPVSVRMFPGAGFVAGDPCDIDEMNMWARRYGWSCRFYRSTVPGCVGMRPALPIEL